MAEMRDFPTVVNDVYYFADMSTLFEDRKSALEYLYGPIVPIPQEDRKKMVQPVQACVLSYMNGGNTFDVEHDRIIRHVAYTQVVFRHTKIVAQYRIHDENRFFLTDFDVETYAKNNGDRIYGLVPVLQLESLVRCPNKPNI